MRQYFFIVLALISISSTYSQQVLTNLPFDCKSCLDGFYRDLTYCDVFHVCAAGEQKRTYGCPQVGERFYFDANTQKCEFANSSSSGCPSNRYYTQITSPSIPPGSQLSTQAPTEPWKIFVQSKEQFTCANRQDGFYASRWCNVFYRCYAGVSNVFLCPLQRGGSRLWWVQHGSQQVVPEGPAQCVYPCDTGRTCSSPGGVLVDNGNQISESQQEAETVYRQSPCTNGTRPTGTGQTGTGQTGTGQTGTGQTGTGQTGTGQTGTGQTGTGQTGTGGCPPGCVSVSTGTVPCPAGCVSISGTGQTGTGQTGTGQTGTGQTGTGQTGTGNQGGSSGAAGTFTVDSSVSCEGQPDESYLSSPYCNVFHRCVSGTRFDLRCPKAVNSSYDLWWNQQTNLCDWPCRVQCNNRLYGSSSTAQQVSSESLRFFNNDCRAYPLIFNSNKN